MNDSEGTTHIFDTYEPSRKLSFFTGITNATFFMMVLGVVPYIVYTIFNGNLDDDMIVLSASALPACFVVILTGFLQRRALLAINAIAHLVAGFSCTILGAMFFVGFDATSFTNVLMIPACLTTVFCATYTSIILFRQEANFAYITTRHTPKTRLAYTLGFSTLLVGASLVQQALNSWPALLFASGAVLCLIPVVRTRGGLTGEYEKKGDDELFKNILRKSTRARVRYNAISLAMLFMMALFMVVYELITKHQQLLLIAMLGATAGFLARSVFTALKENTSAYFTALLVAFVVNHATGFQISLPIAILAGFVAGATLVDFFSCVHGAYTRHGQNAGGWCLILVLVLVIGVFLAYEFTYTVRNGLEEVWIAYLILAIVGTIVIPNAFLRRKGAYLARIKASARASRTILIDAPVRIKKSVAIASIIALASISTLTGALVAQSGLKVYINLDTAMYDVNGNLLTSVQLEPASARILLFDPNATGRAHGELIRPGKSIRVGGYYYGFGENISKEEIIDWLGSTNDVFATALTGWALSPTDFASIRGMNPNLKWYYMTYGTTLYEDPDAPSSGPDWGNAPIATVQFNETIHDWTVKLANGSEALGVRRNSIRSSAHLMDLGRMEWADYFAWIYENRCRIFGADGVAIDEVMWRGYWDVQRWNGGVPLRDYATTEEITATCYSWLQRIDSKMDVEIITQAFWPEAQQYQQGIWGEIAFRAGGHYGDRVDDRMRYVWYEFMNWQGIVENARDIVERNESYIWAAWYKQNDTGGLEYSLATYLMAKPNGCTSLVFQPHAGHYPDDGLVGYAVANVAKEMETYPEFFDIELGDALGPMELKHASGGDYWQRTFENGIVLVNPFRARLHGF